MKFFQNLNKKRILFIFKGPMSFGRACFFSILLHGLLFLFMAFLVGPFDVTNPDEPPLMLDFVFMPTKDYQEAINVSTSTAKGVKIHSVKSGLPSEELVNQVGDSKTQPVNLNENEDSSDKLSNASYIPEQRGILDVNEPFFISALRPPPLKLPRTEISEPELLPVKISMPQRQQRILLKKAKKLAEKLHKMEWSDTLFVWEDRKQTFEVKLHRKPAKTATALDEVVFEVTTKEDGHTLSTEMRLRRLAFSNFAQLVDYWDPQVAVHDDEFAGRFHTNSTFTISGRGGIIPKFHGKVTTSAYEVKTSDSSPVFDQESIFIGGIETGAKEIHLPKTFLPFPNDTAVDSRRVHKLTEDTWITFHRDGSYSWKTESSQEVEHRKIIPQESFFILGDKKTAIHLKGVLKGKVLVYSAGNIIIDDDLHYARNPEISLHADDFLGLVSQKDIEIAHPSVTGPGDLQICAAIYARRRFRVPYLRGNGEATLHIYGSLSAGSLTATEPRYATRVVFDKRLETIRPPNFPLTERYEMIEWDRQWKIKKP